MYGTRDAAQHWDDHYSQAHHEIGFEQGMASTGVFVHKEKNLIVVIHLDDFTALGHGKDLDWYRNWYRTGWTRKLRAGLDPGGML